MYLTSQTLTILTILMLRELATVMILENLHLNNRITTRVVMMMMQTKTQRNEGDTMVGTKTCYLG